MVRLTGTRGEVQSQAVIVHISRTCETMAAAPFAFPAMYSWPPFFTCVKLRKMCPPFGCWLGDGDPPGERFRSHRCDRPRCRLQVVEETRTKQLEQWRSLLVAWHVHHAASTLVVRDWPHWENAAIGRAYRILAVRAVSASLLARFSGAFVHGKSPSSQCGPSPSLATSSHAVRIARNLPHRKTFGRRHPSGSESHQ